MNIIIFSHRIDGHFLEYVHHVYELALEKKEHHFVFLLPNSFLDVKEKFEWETKDHIAFDLYDDFKSTNIRRGLFQLLEESNRVSKFVAQAAKKHKAEYVFSNTIINFVPFAPLHFKKPVKLMGVVYRIYLHDMDCRNKVAVFLDKLKYKLMVHSRVFYKIFVLNDPESASKLNKLYKTAKFLPIADPYVPISTEHLEDIRELFGIEKSKKLFVHFGAMNTNKATLEILESMKGLTPEEKRNYSFFFAGRVESDIKDRFYQLYEELKNDVQIIVKDEFCSYEFFASLCTACDAILTPYRRTAQSSGLIGYASQFGKPVIAVTKGLLGQLVREYELGVLIDDNDPDSMEAGYRRIAEGNFKKPTKKYCEQNSIESFQKTIIDSLV